MVFHARRQPRVISIHALRKESDLTREQARLFLAISIHALRKESDVQAVFDEFETQGISIHVLRKESDRLGDDRDKGLEISIHALRKESDSPWARTRPNRSNFNPRSP